MVLALAGASVAASSARGATRQLWYSDHYNAVATAIAGVPLIADGEDDYAEWSLLLAQDDPVAVLGFTAIYTSPDSLLYHRIFLAPPVWSTLEAIDSAGIDSVAAADAAEAIMTLTHEAFHQRLFSADESRVNACALQYFPWVIETQFAVPATIDQTVSTPTTSLVSVKRIVRVRVRGKLTRRVVYRTVRRIAYVDTVETITNPTHDLLVAASRAFYDAQPPPYNTGTCY